MAATAGEFGTGSCSFHVPRWTPGRRLGGERLEVRLVRVVAVGAEQIALGAVPVAGATSVNAGAPVAILLAMALPAHAIRLFERHLLATGQMQDVAIVRVMAIETPAMRLVVLEDDFGVH